MATRKVRNSCLCCIHPVSQAAFQTPGMVEGNRHGTVGVQGHPLPSGRVCRIHKNKVPSHCGVQSPDSAENTQASEGATPVRQGRSPASGTHTQSAEQRGQGRGLSVRVHAAPARRPYSLNPHPISITPLVASTAAACGWPSVLRSRGIL